MKTISIRRIVRKNGVVYYRFHKGPITWSKKDLNMEDKFNVLYNKNMEPEDIIELKKIWGHKIANEEKCDGKRRKINTKQFIKDYI